MNNQIGVDKQTVRELFSRCQRKKFVVPEYQRPYAWGEEQVEKLFFDLWDFTVGMVAKTPEDNNEDKYFLGTLVMCDNEKDEQEIIDGQQRITSLFLLLRVIYRKIEELSSKSKNDEYLLSDLSKLIWEYDMRNHIAHRNVALIRSEVINATDNMVLNGIIEKGETCVGALDNYSNNYKLLIKLLDEACTKNFNLIYDFVINVLDNTILLSITTDTEDTALTVFSTLNDSGLQLSDADIFKAKIYKNKSIEDRKNFIELWKQLEEDTANIGESIQRLFTYHMYYLKAKHGDTKTQMVSIRKFYKGDKDKGKEFSELNSPTLMTELFEINSIWKVVNTGSIFGTGNKKTWSMDLIVRKTLDILSSYPNEFWKYPVVTYYLVHKNDIDFIENFRDFLRMLTCFLVKNYLVSPTINAVKTPILNLDKEIFQNARPKTLCCKLQIDDQMIKLPSKNIVKMLLKILAYEYQDQLLESGWEIEHILPQKWQQHYSPKEKASVVDEMVEHIGNKLPLKKKLNASAGNNYFPVKKSKYKLSNMRIVKEFAKISSNVWDVEAIKNRDEEICKLLRDVLDRWDYTYETVTNLFD